MALSAVGAPATLPTLYEYYTAGGISSGLNADTPNFLLNDKNITIYSGAMQYFRIPRKYWRDRLRKMRAAGLNCVETYVPWNLHEPEIGKFDFGAGSTDFQDMLDIQEYLRIAKEEDLFAIVRPGPYICAELEYGGLPSWLLNEKDIKIRTPDSKFMKHVTRFFNAFIPLLVSLQFTNGGPIIAVQVENEYGSTEVEASTPDKKYLNQIKNLLTSNGIKELLFTSDSSRGHNDHGSLPGVLQTANFAGRADIEFDRLLKLQPGKPVMVMEYWSGWFDHWSENHHTRPVASFVKELKKILDYPGSVNLYMFHGGTSYGFINGANMADSVLDYGGFPPDASYGYVNEFLDTEPNFGPLEEINTTETSIYDEGLQPNAINNGYGYINEFIQGGTNFGNLDEGIEIEASIDNGGLQPDITSNDYDAPINEAGDYTAKYDAVYNILQEYTTIKTKLPERPAEIPKIKYPSVNITHMKRFSSLLETVPVFQSKNVMPMEELPINNNSGQSYGYIVYQIKNLDIPANANLTIEGRVCDTLMVLIDGKLVTKPLLKAEDLEGFGYWKTKDGSLELEYPNGLKNVTLELIVENWGRNSFGLLKQFNQHKGLWQGDVFINDQKLENWNIYPLEFKSNWTKSLQDWNSIEPEVNIEDNLEPGLYKATLTLDSEPTSDTFIDLRGWIKGFVIVNGFILGRHSCLGPQYYLYLPAPFLHKGDNEIIIFEHFTPRKQLDFSVKQIFRKRRPSQDEPKDNRLPDSLKKS